MKSALLLLLLFPIMHLRAQVENTYKEPPREIFDLIMAKPVPSASIDDAGKWMLLLERNTFPSVAELAEPELRIAGLRINPNIFAQSRMSTIAAMRLKDLNSLQEIAIEGLPENMSATSVQWSPSQTKIGFVNLTNESADLYIIDILTSSAEKINKTPLTFYLEEALHGLMITV